MQEISREYLLLFNAITDAGNELNRIQTILQSAQQRAEELFITSQEDPDNAAQLS